MGPDNIQLFGLNVSGCVVALDYCMTLRHRQKADWQAV
jgi:hypothetical protein